MPMAAATAATAASRGVVDDFIPLDHASSAPPAATPAAPNDAASSLSKKRRRNEISSPGTNSPANGPYGRKGDQSSLPPWLRGRAPLEWGSVSQILHNEVRMFAEYIQPTAEEHLVRELVVERIKRSVQSIWGNGAVARAFGSYATKMYLPAGDIDICVVFSDPSMTSSKPAVQRALNRLASELRKQGVPKELMVIGKARVPIIKLTERITGIKIDISMSSLTGLQCIPLVLQYAHGEFPDGLQPLVMAIKHFLAMRKMNEVFTGGLGSYATILLAVSMLQMHPLLQSGRIKASNNLGVLLLEFFELYGQRFNYERVGVCVNHGGSYFDKLQAGFGNDKQADMLCIRDPLDSTNDVARSTFGMHKVRRAFEQAYNILTTVMYNLNTEMAMDMDRLRKQQSQPSSLLANIFQIPDSDIKFRDNLAQVLKRGDLQKMLGISNSEIEQRLENLRNNPNALDSFINGNDEDEDDDVINNNNNNNIGKNNNDAESDNSDLEIISVKAPQQPKEHSSKRTVSFDAVARANDRAKRSGDHVPATNTNAGTNNATTSTEIIYSVHDSDDEDGAYHEEDDEDEEDEDDGPVVVGSYSDDEDKEVGRAGQVKAPANNTERGFRQDLPHSRKEPIQAKIDNDKTHSHPGTNASIVVDSDDEARLELPAVQIVESGSSSNVVMIHGASNGDSDSNNDEDSYDDDDDDASASGSDTNNNTSKTGSPSSGSSRRSSPGSKNRRSKASRRMDTHGRHKRRIGNNRGIHLHHHHQQQHHHHHHHQHGRSSGNNSSRSSPGPKQ